MSVTTADHILETRGAQRQLDAFVVAAAFDRAGNQCAFGLGDGTAHLVSRGALEDWTSVAAHDGALLSLAPDAAPTGFITGGDDGGFLRIGPTAGLSQIASHGMKWVEQVASFTDSKTRLLACSVGKRLFLFDGAAKPLKTLEHPSSVTGIVFDAKGKRVATSHYNGASLWFVGSKTDNPRKLEWKGSHTGIAMSPDGENIVTTMQENALHGWRLTDGQHMRMTGYPSKTAALSFTRSGKWLASSGAEAVVLWPFTGGGPMGKAPTELAGGDNVLCTYVACHPAHEAVAAGFSDGLVVMVDIAAQRILPIAAAGRGSISALAWSGDGTHLAFGSETGFAAVVDFTKR